MNTLLLLNEKRRNEARGYELERRLIPHQQRLVEDNKRLGLPFIADLRILEGMKREYKAVMGREYQ